MTLQEIILLTKQTKGLSYFKAIFWLLSAYPWNIINFQK